MLSYGSERGGGGDGFILASLYAEVVSDWREGGVMGSRLINLR